MNSKLKAKIESALDEGIRNSDENMWDGYIHKELTGQMADAAEAVFDSSMLAQKFVASET